MNEQAEPAESIQEWELTPKGHLAALLHRRFGISIRDGEEVWDVLSETLTHHAKRRLPDCDAAAVVLVGGGEVIPLFKATEPEIQEPETGV